MGVKSTQVEVDVCESCGWTDKKIRKALRALAETYEGRIQVRKVSCLDECSDEPVVKIGKKCLAPATPKKLEKRIARLLD